MKSVNFIFSLIVSILVLLSSLIIPFNQSNQYLEAATNWSKSEVNIENEKYITDSYVIKDGTTYKMWYTHLNPDMGIGDVYTALSDPDLNSNLYVLLSALQNYDFNGFLNAFADLTPADMTNIKAIFDGISTVIGYATSTDGKSWIIQDSDVLSGSSNAFWASVGFPCVIKNSDTFYQMWYTSIQTTLTEAELQSVFSNMAVPANRSSALATLLGSTKTVIGYATSSNGIDWIKVATPALSVSGSTGSLPDSICAASIMRVTNSNWLLYNSISLPSVMKSTDGNGLSSDRDTSQAVVKVGGGTWSLFDSVGAPSVIKVDDDNYKMWFTRFQTDFDSTDLDALLAEVQNGTVDLNDLLVILSSTSSVIGYATSNDGGNTFTIVNNKVFPGDSDPAPAFWQSIADPCVVNTGNKYEMWYMNGTTNLDQDALRNALNEVKVIGIPNLWNSLKTKTLENFIIQDLQSINFAGLETALTGTGSVIGYASSIDGISWNIQNAIDLSGETTTPWSSIGAPSIVKSSSKTEIWYAKGISSLTWQNVADRILGDDSGVGYASVTFAIFGGGGGAEPPPISGISEVCWPLTPSGYTTVDITLWSEDEICSVFIPKTTKTMTMDFEELKCISISLMEPSPSAPEGKTILVAYNIEPEGAFFEPAISINMAYDTDSIPEGVDESDLELVYLDSMADVWTNLDDVVLDTENHIISGNTNHFTAFGIMCDEGITQVVPTETPPATPELGPAVFVTSALTISPDVVEINEMVTIDVTVTNTGEQAGTYTVKLLINAIVSDTKEVALRVGESRTITFVISEDIAGTYDVVIDKLTGSFSVQAAEKPPVTPVQPELPEPKPINWWLIIGSIIVGVVIVVITGWLIMSRRGKV